MRGYKPKDPFTIRYKNPQGDKLVGGYFPRPVADYLVLAGMYEASSTSTILRRLIDNFVETGVEERQIIETLAERGYQEWLSRIRGKYHPPKYSEYEGFIKEMQDTLIRKGLSAEKADEVVSQIELKVSPSIGSMINDEEEE